VLQQRLGIYLEQADALTEKREDFELKPLDQFFISQDLVRTRMTGNDLNACRSAQMALGQFPHGNVGTLVYNEMSSAVEQFVHRVERLQEKRVAGPWEERIDIGDFSLQVRMPEIYDRGLIKYRYANQRAQDLLRSWIYHLAYCDTAQSDWPQTSVIIFKNTAWQFDRVDDPRTFLTDLLTTFITGLEKPLHLFPNTSLEYIQQQQINGRSEKAAMALARQKWFGSDFSRGESGDPYFDVCFKLTDPLDAAFARVSKAVFGPLLAHGTRLANGSLTQFG
jgi:exodeoxyribonuclease V gamma subunit